MPIFDQSYKRYEGKLGGAHRRWAAIARRGIASLFRKRSFLLLIIFSLIPLLVHSVQIFLVKLYPGGIKLLEIGSTFFYDFLRRQYFFIVLIAIYAGAGLIASDSKAKALELYLSKPISTSDYAYGKFMVVAAPLLLITLVPALLLFCIQVGVQNDLAFLKDHYWLLGSILVYSLVQVIVFSLLIMAFSSGTNNLRYAGIGFAALLICTDTAFKIIRLQVKSTFFSVVSIQSNLEQVGSALFAQPLPYQSPLLLNLVVLLFIVGLTLFIIGRRVRGVEVVQ